MKVSRAKFYLITNKMTRFQGHCDARRNCWGVGEEAEQGVKLPLRPGRRVASAWKHLQLA